MKTLIILKSLVKRNKLEWVEKEGLGNYYLDISTIQKLYSAPELYRPGIDILSRSHSSTVYTRFMEILCLRLSKGCLVVVDMDMESTSTVETLATVFGYEVFYVVQPIPQDYVGKPKKYSIPGMLSKKREELEREVGTFLNLQLDGKTIINSYSDILEYWKKSYPELYLDPEDTIVHVSDIHSNYGLIQERVLEQTKDLHKTYHIFYGDYIDGPQQGGSREMIEYILKSKGKRFIFLEGNHEIRLRKYLAWMWMKGGNRGGVADVLYSSLPEDFLTTTAKEFEGLTKIEAWNWLKELNKKLRPFLRIRRGDDIYICTHAGVKWLEQLTPKHVGNVIYGNRDMDAYDKEFSKYQTKSGFTYYSIHAHCKYPAGWEPCKYPNVVNLDPPSESEIVYMIDKNSKNFQPCLEK